METGKVFEINRKVEKQHLAVNVGSGDQEVLATPVLIAWMEAAAVACLDLQDKSKCSLGVKVDIEHVAATPLGADVKITAKITEGDGKKYSFFVEAYDSHEKIGFGSHVRVVTNAERFMERTNSKIKG